MALTSYRREILLLQLYRKYIRLFRQTCCQRKCSSMPVCSKQFNGSINSLAKTNHIFKPHVLHTSNFISMHIMKVNTHTRNANENMHTTLQGKPSVYLEYVQSLTKVSSSYIFDPVIAEKIVTLVLKNRANPKSPILEIEAGSGVMSREFLKQGVSRVVALETKSIFANALSEIQEEMERSRFFHVKWHMLNYLFKLDVTKNCSATANYEKMESEVFKLLQLDTQLHENDVPYSIFLTGGKDDNVKFMYYIFMNFPHQDVILSNGRVEFFFFCHPKIKKRITYLKNLPSRKETHQTPNSKERVYTSIFSYVDVFLFLLYDITFIEEFDNTSFVPSFRTYKNARDKTIDTSKRILVKLQAKKDIADILPLEHHLPFMNFMRQLFRKKRARTIPIMEMLLPGCGLRMLDLGFTMMDLILTSQPREFLSLYKHMIEWPEYKTSPLRSHIMMKTTGTNDDLTDTE
ncbi:uncharacterized protein LOC131943374 [Physella acuta]|uniref:uncharacterized protein LOC131943374 n=1 Tax=Physella acuta TaxID=109671 RepID=UPI0027DD9BA2|nr:uncharacterized protein LOC131943374 [Physella acuta]XP_059159454.1 uncharacterized protein LOC131943374 [Physella acuta]XP_059159463.1 uncharacterized protein LOC131943374 [Physella acuta]XP_059159471.1 uncharacterized protein LOC131943374 [Physella acuta]XP_059159476.1 uncharacterized protein LOC131943374 [Physella acuta]XP_059159484.1 uncharacterized protein LOC131943374 [Physella acuta]